MHIYVKLHNFIFNLLIVFPFFCFDSELFLVIVCMLPSSNHLKSSVSVFIHDALCLPEIRLKKKNNSTYSHFSS